MFDGLQEGVIVVDSLNIGFMNDLSNKLLTELSGMKNFLKKKVVPVLKKAVPVAARVIPAVAPFVPVLRPVAAVIEAVRK